MKYIYICRALLGIAIVNHIVYIYIYIYIYNTIHMYSGINRVVTDRQHI